MLKTVLIVSSLLGLIITGCRHTRPTDSFTKIDAQGEALATNATDWSCVLDSDSDLMWERKTENGRRWWNTGYPNTTNPANEPTTARGRCAYDEAGGNDLVVDETCHTEGYVEYINGLNLCGYEDWRMPSREEMLTILDENLAPPFLNRSYFPYPNMFNIWTGDDATGNNAFRFYLLHAISPVSQLRSTPMSVLLVRGGN